MALAELDHLVVSAATLAEGVAYVEEALGVAMAGGGEHAHMGTHNRLLSLGPSDYLEVIAVDPLYARPSDRADTAPPRIERLALHAWRYTLPPEWGETRTFTCPLPADFRDCLAALRERAGG